MVGQLAAINWAILRLYTPDDSNAIEDRIADVETLVSEPLDEWVKKDIHLLLGRVYLLYGLSEERSLEHYLDAGEIV